MESRKYDVILTSNITDYLAIYAVFRNLKKGHNHVSLFAHTDKEDSNSKNEYLNAADSYMGNYKRKLVGGHHEKIGITLIPNIASDITNFVLMQYKQ